MKCLIWSFFNPTYQVQTTIIPFIEVNNVVQWYNALKPTATSKGGIPN